MLGRDLWKLSRASESYHFFRCAKRFDHEIQNVVKRVLAVKVKTSENRQISKILSTLATFSQIVDELL